MNSLFYSKSAYTLLDNLALRALSYKINYKVKGDYLKVHITGVGGNKNLGKISADVRELVNKYSVSRVLVDSSQSEGKLGIFESLDHIDNYPPEMRNGKYAILSKPEDKQQNSFFENAAVNRGYQIYFFYDEKEALKWLNVAEDEVPDMVLEKEY